ncbi:hypothetical protein SAMN06297251_103260 [Fulvimarina manganoxydans]|uniref:Uncharacterized protein n=1 Tax=Fulvimarina manganoxydans TaxID=937218 RepID=A0A1W2A0A1_9HYPH|nr:hypothetical protein SAMN06297251_103260 [Fulvimarina manganoxydans]
MVESACAHGLCLRLDHEAASVKRENAAFGGFFGVGHADN